MADVIISVRIENVYEDGTEIETTVTDSSLPAPMSTGSEELELWAEEYLRPLTGTGRVSGDACYDVHVTACSLPALVGQHFAYGY
ncbi:hypothetical protein GCM10027586_08210 [Kineococcus gypseus]|uniref:hypothetical protein n=1 Tax=Kineococcus gypseus TaxID=1637102 RepID=UPI003D7C3899